MPFRARTMVRKPSRVPPPRRGKNSFIQLFIRQEKWRHFCVEN
jgi:hypothetical protein